MPGPFRERYRSAPNPPPGPQSAAVVLDATSADGDVLAGSLESRALQFVREWAALRHDEILANWERARRNEPLLGIDRLA
jgi:Domain of unknown function (DUF4160)